MVFVEDLEIQSKYIFMDIQHDQEIYDPHIEGKQDPLAIYNGREPEKGGQMD